MDYRERRYFLIRLGDYNKELEELKKTVPSIKFYKPYNHFQLTKAGKKLKAQKIKACGSKYADIYDGDVLNRYVQQMVSCRKEHAGALLNYFNTSDSYKTFFELTKETCKH